MAAYNFQWQNPQLLKDIYPMRLQKLRDFLVFYKEADLWAEYRNKDISTLAADVAEYEKGMDNARAAEFKKYSTFKNYFLTKDVSGFFVKYKPVEPEAMALIQKNHDLFIASWPKDIRGERTFIQSRIESFKTQLGFLRDRVRYLQRQLEGMLPEHPNRPKVEAEFKLKNESALPMVLEEMEKLRQFDETYNKLEGPKLEWYKLSKADPNYKVTEEEFLVNYDPKIPVTVKDIVRLKVEQYTKTLEGKDQYQLLADIRARFEKEPKRFPLWLQYMIVHFSGMRYKSAHGSWADPKDLLVRLRLADLQKEQLALSDADVAAKCQEKIAQYEGTAANKPGLAKATEKAWKDKVALHMQSVKANGPKTKRAGLAALVEEEARYEFMTMTTDQALVKLEAMKSQLPAWAWKWIVMLTPLRINHVNAEGWETFTPEEDKIRFADTALYPIFSKWASDNTGMWRPEHGRTQEIIVTRAVCNETAEHIQHIRGHLPPGGLTDNAARYVKLAAEKAPGTYFIKPTEAKHYTQGASIFWLRYVNSEPSQWQIPKPTEDSNGVGLVPAEFIGKRPQPKAGKNAPTPTAPWEYKGGGMTRTRTTLDAEKKKVTQTQWLRWIHEATVIEVVDTADGTYVYTFETSLPDDFRGTSCLGVFRNTLRWNLDDGTEDNYNRSFVGYAPEGKVPLENLKPLMDWNRIILK
ncbi:MAG: hypothetical protein DPW18_10445 [Chloroflexi bacterium]|nr:MAG: hypothetical protein EDM79_08875 [Chloroflexota bacterium]MCQ3937450.1 hypothetical protein [Chloroflexota bacterium]MDL1943909.1 hypothetical protein [Chloroflexi bacterium CFX2]